MKKEDFMTTTTTMAIDIIVLYGEMEKKKRQLEKFSNEYEVIDAEYNVFLNVTTLIGIVKWLKKPRNFSLLARFLAEFQGCCSALF